MSTDDTRPDTIDPDDELASAFLDGEVDAAERARVEADPALRARVEDLARVRDALGTPPQPSDEIRDATIAAVLAATVDTAPSGTIAPAPVTSLASRRRSRTVWAVVAAAAVVLVAVPAALVAVSQQTATEKFDAVGAAIDGDDSATITESSPSAPAAAGPDVASGGATRAGGAVTTTAPSMSATADASAETSGAAAMSLGDLGRFERAEDLAAAASVPEGLAAPSTTADSSTPSSTAVPPTTVAADRSTTTTMAATAQPICVAAGSAVLPSAGVLVRSATATYQGVPVEVLVFGLSDPPDGAEWLVVLDRADCAVLFDQAL